MAKPPKKALPLEDRVGVKRQALAAGKPVSEAAALLAQLAAEPPCGSYQPWQRGVYVAVGTYVGSDRRIWRATQNIPSSLNFFPPHEDPTGWSLIGPCPLPPAPTVTSMTPDNGLQVMTTTPTLSATATTWEGGAVAFYFEVCDNPSMSGCHTYESCCLLSGSRTVPEGVLSWGRQYWWRVRVSDASTIGGQSGYSSTRTLVVGVRQPTITSQLSTPGVNGQEFHQSSGNYTTTFTDVQVPVAGPPLSVVRSYNSMDPRREGVFGAGWSTRWDMRVVEESLRGRAAALVTYPDGRQVRFAKKDDGGWQPPPGMYATLAKNSDGGWRLMDKSSTSYVFDSAGRLLKVTDQRGRSQDLEYGSDGKLAKATATGGRSLTFAWTGSHVTSVSTDPVDGKALTWTYSYDGDVLTKVCNPQQECTSYDHESGSLYRSTVLDSEPMGYWRFGETDGDSAKDLGWLGDAGYSFAGGYTLGRPGALAGTPDTAVGISASDTGAIWLPNGIIPRAGAWAAIETWFKTTSSGTLMTVEGEYSYITFPMLQVTADGKLSAGYDAASRITTSVAVKNGAWHHAVLTAEGDRQTLYVDGVVAGSFAGEISETTPFYTDNLKLGGLDGTVDEVAVYDRPLSPAEVARHYAARAAAPHKLTKTTLPSGRVWAANTYDPATDRIKSHTDNNGGTWQIGEPAYDTATGMSTVTVKDPNNESITTVHDAWRGYRTVSKTDQLGKKTSYTYDTGGFLAQVDDANFNFVRYDNDDRGNVLATTTCRTSSSCQTVRAEYYVNTGDQFDARNDRVTKVRDARSTSATDNTYATGYEYNSYGEQTKLTTPATLDFPTARSATVTYTDGTEPAVGGGTTPAGLIETNTDAKGNVTELRYTAAGDLAEQTDPSGLITKLEHDVLGRVTGQTQISDAHPNGVKTIFTYDGAGRLATQTAPSVKNEITSVSHTAETSYTYDPDGNTLTATVKDLTGGDQARTTTYTYNAYGREETATDPEGGVVRTTWNKVGLQDTVTDQLGSVFGYTYTKRGELEKRTLKNWTGSPVNPQPATEITLESYSYDDGGRLAAQVDAMLRKTSYTYFGDGLLSQVIGDDVKLNGATTTKDVALEVNTYDAAGNLTKQVIGADPISGVGVTTSEYVYDAAGRLSSATLDPAKLQRKTVFEYDANDQTIKETYTGAAGGTRAESVSYGYNAAGVLTRQTVENGDEDLTTTWTVDDRGLTTAVTDPRGNAAGASAAEYTTTNSYDALGRLIEIRAPTVSIEKAGTAQQGRPTTRIGYNNAGWQTHVIDPEGRLATTGFDRMGRRTSLTAMPYTPPGGTQVTPTIGYGYDAAGRLTTVTDPRGQVTTTEYDALGNPVRVTDPPAAAGQPAGQWISEYNWVGEQLTVIDPTGARVQATYDDLGRQITQTVIERKPASAAYVTTLTYNDAGYLTKEVLPGSKTTDFVVNAAGEVESVTDPAREITKYSYDALGRPAKATDPLEKAMVGEYDLAGRLTSVKSLDKNGATVRTIGLGYDAAGNATRYTSGEGHVTRRSYDATDLLTELVEPVSAGEQITTSFGYDATGARTRVTDGRGNATWTGYNSLGLIDTLTEPATTAHPNLADRTWTHVYDVVGNETALIQPGGVRHDKQYDNLNRLTKVSGSGAGIVADDKTYSYDLADRPTTVSGNTLEYNDRSLLTKLTTPAGTSTAYAYDALGNPTQRVDAVGTTTYTWDADNRLKTVADPVSGRTNTYDYDKADRLTTITSANPANTQAFTYDALDRVETHTLKNSSGGQLSKITYGWDKDDNLTSKVTEGLAGAGSNTYGYDHAGRLTSWTGPDGTTTAYGWDASGNRTKAGEKTFTYDERNRLLEGDGSTYTYTPRGTLATQTKNGNTRNLTFDAFDRLINDGDATYTYDAFDRMLTRQKTGGTQRFAYAGLDNDIIAITDQAGAVQSSYGRDPFGGLISVKEGTAPATGALTDLHQDLVGTFTGTALSSTTTYNPFGEVTAQTGTKPALGYQGEYTDPDTGKVNMHARWYQPGTGTFTSRDTWTLTPDPSIHANRYTYGAGSPLLTTDPSGHAPNRGCYRLVGIPIFGVAGAVACDVLTDAKPTADPSHDQASGPCKTHDPRPECNRPPPDPCAEFSNRCHGKKDDTTNKDKDTKKPDNKPTSTYNPPTTYSPPAKREPVEDPCAVMCWGPELHRPNCGKKCMVDPNEALEDIEEIIVVITLGAGAIASLVGVVAETVAPVIGAPIGLITSPSSNGGASEPPADRRPPSPDFIIHCQPNPYKTGECIDGVGAVDKPTAHSCDPGKPNSFAAGTKVLLADGTTKAIEDIKIGDEVIAADPVTGRTSAEPVTALIEGQGLKRLVKITVDTDVGDGAATKTITATDNHPFWVPAMQQWVDAGRLQPGMWLQTAAGTYVQVAAVEAWAAVERVYNLTVDDLHTYHVVAGGASVLVHNVDPDCNDLPPFAPKGPTSGRGKAADGTTYNIKSGRQDPDLSDWVNDKLRKTNHLKGNAKAWTSTHVEAKMAAIMDRDGITKAELDINNPNGPCAVELGCDRILDDLLGDNELTVRWPGSPPEGKTYGGSR
ncbi:polymorphic toxin-type HINT domain-containing protein [Nonomuraea monospora]|uniref:polymorphic toxin-type HINT domain-containing protein n=1 Tax=Nonomuraea monospora TaxID=568818 RepID=UPI0031D803CF